jgi:spore coat polysaccharide biosynthesis protein SpsF
MQAPDLLVIVQARMTSQRLPGKVLRPLAGRPLLGHLCDSLLQAIEPAQLVVATSSDPSDDPIEEFCRRSGLSSFRGDLNNVASRFLEIIQTRRPVSFARVSADSPLLDYRALLKGVQEFEHGEFDLVSTVGGGGFPSGMNIEIIRAASFVQAYPRFRKPEHFEHVTRFFYERPDEFKIRTLFSSLPAQEDGRSYKFSVDTPEDWSRMEKLFSFFERPHYYYSLMQKCQYYRLSVTKDGS